MNSSSGCTAKIIRDINISICVLFLSDCLLRNWSRLSLFLQTMTNPAIFRILFLLSLFIPTFLSAKKTEFSVKNKAAYGLTEGIKISSRPDSIPIRRTPENKPDEKQHPGNKKPDVKKPDTKKPQSKKPDIKSVPQARPKLKPSVPGKGRIKPVKVPKPKVMKHLKAF